MPRKKQSQALALPEVKEDLQLWSEIAYKTVKGDLTTAQDVADAYFISYEEALAIIVNPTFATYLHNIQIAIAKHEFNTAVIPELFKIAKADKDLHYVGQDGEVRGVKPNEQVAAAKELKDILGFGQKSKALNININFEKMVREIDSGDDDVIDITPFPGFEQ